MKFNPVEWIAFIALIFILLFIVTGCSTVWGVGKDISTAAEWTHDKITNKSAPAETKEVKAEKPAK
jgi:predicted small secreted protein